MTNFIITLNAVGPIFILMGLGFVLQKYHKLDEVFVKQANYIVFQFGLPLTLFNRIYQADLASAFNPLLMLYALITLVIVTGLLSLLIPRFIANRQRASAFIQGAFRSNFTLLGTVMSLSLFGEDGAVPTISLLPVVIPALMVLSIIVFSVFGTDEGHSKLNIGGIVRKVVTNPLIVGIAVGALFQMFSLQLPVILQSSVNYLARITTPLALIALGAQLKFEDLADVRPVLACSGLKLIIIPVAVLVPAYLLGFRGYELGALFLLFAAPAGVSNYALAYNMKSDYIFTGRMIVISTVLSFITMFVGIFLMKTMQIF